MRKHARWAHSSVAAILGGGSKYWSPSIDAAGLVRGHSSANGTGNNTGSDADSDTGGGSRWGMGRSAKTKRVQDNPLVSAFTKLRSDLKGCKGVSCASIFIIH